MQQSAGTRDNVDILREQDRRISRLERTVGAGDLILISGGFDPAIIDGTASTPSLRTLGPGATQAAGGTDSRLSDARNPIAGSVVNASVSGSAAIAESKLSLASDAAAGTPSRRTLGTGALQAAAGNDARLSDCRTPCDGTVTGPKVHSSLVNPAAATAGLRTLGAGALQAVAGTDPRLSDARPALAHVHPISDITSLQAALDAKAPLASPAFTGTVTIDGTVNLYASSGKLKTDDALVVGNGRVYLGDAEDTSIHRLAANTLMTDNQFVAGWGSVYLGSAMDTSIFRAQANAVATEDSFHMVSGTAFCHHSGSALGELLGTIEAGTI